MSHASARSRRRLTAGRATAARSPSTARGSPVRRVSRAWQPITAASECFDAAPRAETLPARERALLSRREQHHNKRLPKAVDASTDGAPFYPILPAAQSSTPLPLYRRRFRCAVFAKQRELVRRCRLCIYTLHFCARKEVAASAVAVARSCKLPLPTHPGPVDRPTRAKPPIANIRKHQHHQHHFTPSIALACPTAQRSPGSTTDDRRAVGRCAAHARSTLARLERFPRH